jgi:hypothetical protein
VGSSASSTFGWFASAVAIAARCSRFRQRHPGHRRRDDETHVKRILAKLGLRDRAQAVVVAYESGLVTPRG